MIFLVGLPTCNLPTSLATQIHTQFLVTPSIQTTSYYPFLTSFYDKEHMYYLVDTFDYKHII